MTPTEEQIMKIWAEIPPQGDPTGKKFAVVFAKEVLDRFIANMQGRLQTTKE